MTSRLLFGLVALALTALPASADAAIFRVSVAPEVATFPETRELTYRVEISTTAAERLAVAVGGNELVMPQLATLEGPGKLGPVSSTHGDPPACPSLGFRERHHLLSYSYEYTLELPEDSVSTLVLKARLSEDAPPPGRDYRLSLGVPGGAPIVPARGPKGVPISIATDPVSPACSFAENPGVPITIMGTTDPALAGEELVLMMRHGSPFYYGSPVTTEHELAKVKVASDGTFWFGDWRPQEVGYYAIQAQYRSSRPEHADDFSPPLGFRLQHPVPLPAPLVAHSPPSTTTAVLAVALRTVTVRRGMARVRLRCPRALPCRGTVRLKIRGAFTQWRSFWIATGGEKVVAVRVGPSVVRALRTGRLGAVAQVRLNDLLSRTPVRLRASREQHG